MLDIVLLESLVFKEDRAEKKDGNDKKNGDRYKMGEDVGRKVDFFSCQAFNVAK